MGNVKELIFVFFLAYTSWAKADWQFTFNRMGFLGEFGVGMIYDWENPHSMEVSIGSYKTKYQNEWQTNIAYRYSKWHIDRGEKVWTPIQFGFFTVRSLDSEEYFIRGPDQYPESNYYDQTALRWGIEFGSALKFKSSGISIAYYFRILDTGIIALYNNGRKDLQYYASSGLSARYHF